MSLNRSLTRALVKSMTKPITGGGEFAAERITNGNFAAGGASWSVNGWVISEEAATLDTLADNYIQQNVGLLLSGSLTVAFTYSGGTNPTFQISVVNDSTSEVIYSIAPGGSPFSTNETPTINWHTLKIVGVGADSVGVVIDNISLIC